MFSKTRSMSLRRSKKNRPGRRLRLESLEQRRMMATITVDTLIDEADGDINFGDVSLRDAIAASSQGDVINFNVTGTIELTLGHLLIDDFVTIVGPGADLLTIDASGNDPTPGVDQGDGSRVLRVDDGQEMSFKSVFISGITFTGGDHNSNGGAIRSHESLTLVDSVVTGNAAVGGISQGGGIYVGGGALTLRRTTVSGNQATKDGGGIYITAATANIVDSTISGNHAGADGGGIATRTNLSGTVASINNTTISNNSADRGGGVFNNKGLTLLQHSTVTNNTAPAGRGSGVGSEGNAALATRTEVVSSIVAGNVASDVDVVNDTMGGTDVSIVSNGFNLVGIGNASNEFTNSGDMRNVADPRLGPLKLNAGPTATHALLADSPAIDAGNDSGSARDFDQRLAPFSRVFDGDGNSVAVIDIGAYERQSQIPPRGLVVDSTADELDDNFAPGELSLREAVLVANGSETAGNETITFDASLNGQILALTRGELQIVNPVTIDAGALGDGVTIDASGSDPTPAADNGDGDRVLRIDDERFASTFAVELVGLKLTGGDSSGNGGAIVSVENLTLNDVELQDNHSIGVGGGVAVDGAGTGGLLALNGTKLINNSAAVSGGGIYTIDSTNQFTQSTLDRNTSVEGSGGGLYAKDSVTTVDSSVISLNRADFGGGAAIVGGRFVLLSSTVSGNAATHNRAGLLLSGGSASYLYSSTITRNTTVSNTLAGQTGGVAVVNGSSAVLIHTLLAGNFIRSPFGSPDLNGTVAAKHSLIGNSSGATIIGGPNLVDVDPLLGPLTDNGGATPTHAPLVGSPAKDAGAANAVPGRDGVPHFDQRGFDRIAFGRIDIGALEVQEPIPGDFDGNRDLDVSDLDLLIDQIAQGFGDPDLFDLTGDGLVDLADRDEWLALAGAANLPSGNAYLLGDVNLDGAVDGQDFLVWNANKFTSTAAWSHGDFNADGFVDGQDFLIWNSTKFQSSDNDSRPGIFQLYQQPQDADRDTQRLGPFAGAMGHPTDLCFELGSSVSAWWRKIT